jgi:glycosyltransferase involved in cell wall biosynthesis
MAVLLYITDRWPYHPGESFLTQEIRDLSPHFEKILLLPLAQDIDESKTMRDTRDNVEVLSEVRINIWKKWGKMGAFSRLTTGLAKPIISIKECLRTKPFNPREVIGEAAQVRLICNHIEKNIDVSNVDACTSFWLNRGAFVCAELKRRNPHLVAFARGHGGDIYSERRGMKNFPLQHTALKQLDGVFPDSSAGVDYLHKKFPSMVEKIVVGRLGVDDSDEVSHSSDGILRILSVSSLVPVKRVHLIPKSLIHTKRKIIWTHIGGGDCLIEIEKELANLGDNVEVNLLGQLPHDEVLQYYANNAVDLFINVSSSEGLPVSIMEAFASGIPVIATKVGGSPEIVSEDCGYLLKEDFLPNELANILDNYNLESNEMRDCALNKQRTEYSSEKNQAMFANEIIEAIKKNG